MHRWPNTFHPPRELTEWEREVIGRLAPSAHVDALARLRVTDACDCCASIGLSDIGPHFAVAEADARDEDGATITIMLFADADERVLATLDVLRLDGQPILRLPSPDGLRVERVSRWTGSPDAITE